MAAKTGKGYETHGDRFRVKVRENGKSRYFSFSTPEEAAAYYANQQSPVMKAYRNYQRTGEIIPTAKVVGPTVVAYARDVFAARALKRNTVDSYETSLRRIEREPLGSMEVTTVGARQVREFFGKVEKNRANVKAVLDMTFVAAHREGMIRENPMLAANIKLQKRRQKNIKALTPSEIDRIAEAARHERDALAIRLGGFAGLRAGEVGGLNAEDVDEERCRITIRRNAQRYTKVAGESSSIGIGTPKTDAGERTVPVDCDLVADLVAYIEANPPLADGTIFHTSYGNPVTDQVLSYNLIRAAKAAGLQRTTFHDLRHAYATNLALGGLPMTVLQRVMGWSSIRMTDTYAHVQAEDVDAAAAITARQRNS